MGWQDRDWAKWTAEERADYVGGAPAPARAPLRIQTLGGATSRTTGTIFLAAVASLVVTVIVSQFHLVHLPAASQATASAPLAPLVYGTGLAHLGAATTQEMTCTAMTTARGAESCTTWTYLVAGQRAVQAAPLPTGVSCPVVEADQSLGRWVCASP
ncbi:MAG TPA: hypothetical protein VII51_05575 [Gaiellaceae bacterium]